MALVKDGWDTYNCSAALFRELVSAMVMRYRNCINVTAASSSLVSISIHIFVRRLPLYSEIHSHPLPVLCAADSEMTYQKSRFLFLATYCIIFQKKCPEDVYLATNKNCILIADDEKEIRDILKQTPQMLLHGF